MYQGKPRMGLMAGGAEDYSLAWLGGWGPPSPGSLNKAQKLSRPGDLGSPLRLYVEAVCGQSLGKPESERKATKGDKEKNIADRVGQSVPRK